MSKSPACHIGMIGSARLSINLDSKLSVVLNVQVPHAAGLPSFSMATVYLSHLNVLQWGEVTFFRSFYNPAGSDGKVEVMGGGDPCWSSITT